MQSAIHNKPDRTIVYFFLLSTVFCFAATTTAGDAVAMSVFHLNVNVVNMTIGISLFFGILFVMTKKHMDRITFTLMFSAVLSLIPITYAENVHSYWGNYLSLLVSVLSYFICTQSKADFTGKIFKILCIVSLIISVQLIATEWNLFSSLSFGNFNNVAAKAFIKIPIGDSNYIAAILLPLIVFIMTFKRNRLTWLVAGVSTYALILCRSKNALSIIFILLMFVAIKKAYSFIFKDKSVDRKTKVSIFLVVTAVFGVLCVGVLYLIEGIINDLQFPYYSSYSNHTLNYLDTISSGRVKIFDNELTRFTNHFYLGNGFGYNEGQSRSHNWIIEVLVQRGIIGFSLYLYCVVTLFKKGRQFYNSDPFTKACINLLGVIYIQGLFEVTVFTMKVDFLIWGMAGFLLARTRFLKSGSYERAR